MSNDGNDSNDGSIDAPLKTLGAAKTKVSEVKIEYPEGAKVIFREGEYRFDESAAFNAADSGIHDAPITYQAYTGENVEFKGSAVVDATKTVEITDSRVQESVKTNIIAIELTAEQKGYLRQWEAISGEKAMSNGEMNGVYVNGEAQTLAQWPNGDEYATWADRTTDQSLEYDSTKNPRIDSWNAENNFWIGGYLQYDFQYRRASVESVDATTKIIKINSATDSDGKKIEKVSNSASKRWKAYNLLEELDAPGEYYIDTNEGILYIYPREDVTTLELSLSKDALLSLDGTKNVTFEGIKFSQTRGNAVYMNNVDNVDFADCSFKDISGGGIITPYEGSAVTKARTDKDYWQVQPLNVSYNIDITGCSFENIGSSAVILYGGNVDTLAGSNNTLSDCTINKAAQLAKNMGAVRMGGVGNTITHNEISNVPFQAITHFGNDHVISYNDIHDVITESDDAAAIYCGRNALQRGTVVEYNYIHDLKPANVVRGFNGAIYWDDQVGGMTASNNIFENVNIGVIINGGVDNKVENNVFINVSGTCTNPSKIGAVTALKTTNNVHHNKNSVKEDEYKTFSDTALYDKELYFERYPTLSTLLGADLDRDLSADPGVAVYNKISGNTLVNCDDIVIGSYSTETGTSEALSYNKNTLGWFAAVGPRQ